MDYTITLRSDLSTGMWPKAQQAAAKYQLNKFLKSMPKGTIGYVAGGAPRDWHHGWGCRDLDIFYKVPATYDDMNAAEKVLEKYHTTHNYSGYDYTGQPIVSVHEYPVHSGSLRFRKVQLIRLEVNPIVVIKDFPINLSHIWMDTKGHIKCDFHYYYGYNARIIREVHRNQYNYTYLEKILPRFDDYTFCPLGWQGERPEATAIPDYKVEDALD